jgi:hypothetical protein
MLLTLVELGIQWISATPTTRASMPVTAAATPQWTHVRSAASSAAERLRSGLRPLPGRRTTLREPDVSATVGSAESRDLADLVRLVRAA